MFEVGEADEVVQRVSTGLLPDDIDVDALIHATFQRHASVTEGELADYIPVLALADPAWFGLSLVEVNGDIHQVGDVDVPFSIQSISKAFVLALVCEAIGHGALHDTIGVNNTGLAFNSVVAIELNNGSPMNPMVNAGALAMTALVPGATSTRRWEFIRSGLSRFAGRELELDDAVYKSEAASNERNQAIAKLLESYGKLDGDPAETTDIYTRQCALVVTAMDLAIMGATLADGGVNPLTGERVVSAETCRDTLAVLASCGLYEHSGEWLFEIGLPAKSGVSGGIVAVAPGKGAVGVFSPLIDRAGNSVRGRLACADLARALGLNLFASVPR